MQMGEKVRVSLGNWKEFSDVGLSEVRQRWLKAGQADRDITCHAKEFGFNSQEMQNH